MMNKLISGNAARIIMDDKDKIVREFLPYTNDAIVSLGNLRIPNAFAPIARDYVSFNAQKDGDKIQAAGDFFDYTKGAT